MAVNLSSIKTKKKAEIYLHFLYIEYENILSVVAKYAFVEHLQKNL